jgi:AcrR family transcriptional regulator
VRGDRTRIALVETAERLFAERGIESVSLRDVSAAAGQRNHSAAQYHFGDRAGLVAAVYDHRMAVVNERRHAMLDALADDADDVDDVDDVPGIVRAVVEPLAAVVAETDGWYGRFLARTQWDAFAREVLVELPVLASYQRACDLLAATMTDLPRDVRVGRIDQMGTLAVGTIAGWEWRRHRGERSLPLTSLQDDLVVTITAVLTAPLPATRTELR